MHDGAGDERVGLSGMDRKYMLHSIGASKLDPFKVVLFGAFQGAALSGKCLQHFKYNFCVQDKAD